jgi:hypothetical protein
MLRRGHHFSVEVNCKETLSDITVNDCIPQTEHFIE